MTDDEFRNMREARASHEPPDPPVCRRCNRIVCAPDPRLYVWERCDCNDGEV